MIPSHLMAKESSGKRERSRERSRDSSSEDDDDKKKKKHKKSSKKKRDKSDKKKHEKKHKKSKRDEKDLRPSTTEIASILPEMSEVVSESKGLPSSVLPVPEEVSS